jgi:hypothetical protein
MISINSETARKQVMTTKTAEERARAIVDEACLPVAMASVAKAIEDSIVTALISARAEGVAEGRAAADALSAMLADHIEFLKTGIDDFSYCLFCDEEMWTEEAVKRGFADKAGGHAADCKYATFSADPASIIARDEVLRQEGRAAGLREALAVTHKCVDNWQKTRGKYHDTSPTSVFANAITAAGDIADAIASLSTQSEEKK